MSQLIKRSQIINFLGQIISLSQFIFFIDYILFIGNRLTNSLITINQIICDHHQHLRPPPSPPPPTASPPPSPPKPLTAPPLDSSTIIVQNHHIKHNTTSHPLTIATQTGTTLTETNHQNNEKQTIVAHAIPHTNHHP